MSEATITLNERELKRLVKDAAVLAAWAVWYVPRSNEQIYRAADRVCRLTVWRDLPPAKRKKARKVTR